MQQKKWKQSEVISFVEYKIINETATTEEIEMYEDYRWNEKLDKIKYTYVIKKLIVDMNKEFKGEE
jgi:hypothetical protein